MEKQTIQIAVPADLNFSSLLRHIADEIFSMAKLDKSWCSRLKLVVDELFMNAVKYGSTEFSSIINALFEYDGNEVKFTIEDDGTGKQAASAEELQNIIQKNENNKDFTRTSGRGLSMITKVWTDDMKVTKSQLGGIAITISKKIETTIAPALPPTGIVKQAVEASGAALSVEQKKIPENVPFYEIKLKGEIDKSNIDDIVSPINDQVSSMPDNSMLILDFSDVTYINSTFIGNLAAWYTSLNHKNGSVRLKNMNQQITEILDLVGLLNVLETT